MKLAFGFLRLLFFSLVITACRPHTAFVATPYEPLLVEKRNDLQVSTSFRPFKYVSGEVTYAPLNFMAVRAGYGGFFGLDNFNLSVPFFKSFKKIGAFIAPAVNYQRNVIDREIPGFFYTRHKKYKYNCEYISPALVIGFKLNQSRILTHHLLLKVQYNSVKKYEVSFEKDNNKSNGYSYLVYDNETLNYKIPDFISFEPSYALVNRLTDHLSFKFQAGLNICEKVLRHNYNFKKDNTLNPIISAFADHPRNALFNVGIGLIFMGNAGRKTPEQ